MSSKLVAIMQDNPWHTVTFATLMFTMLGASIGLWGTVMFNWPISAPDLLALLLFFHTIVAVLVTFLIIAIAESDASEEAFECYFLIYLLGIVIFSEVAFLIQPYTFLPIIAMSLLAATLLGIGSILLWGHVFPAREEDVFRPYGDDEGELSDSAPNSVVEIPQGQYDGPQLRADTFTGKGYTLGKDGATHGKDPTPGATHDEGQIAGERCDDEALNGSPSDLYTPGDINTHW